MSSVLDRVVAQGAQARWAEANRRYLRQELRLLRLLLQRRVIWLREQWGRDPLQGYQGLVISDAHVDGLLGGAAHERLAEARFYREHPEAAQLSEQVAALEVELAAWSSGASGDPPALEVVARLFHLLPFERHVLLLVLAPEVDPSFERLYAYVQDDVTRKYATPRLALDLVAGDDDVAARESFRPDRPLRRFRLISVEPGPQPTAQLGARPLRLDERVADFLLGIDRPDERVDGLLHEVPGAPLTDAHLDLVASIWRRLEEQARRGALPALNLVGAPGAGKLAVARALCQRAGLRLCRLDLSRLPAAGPERRELIDLLDREAMLARLAIYLDLAAPAPAGAEPGSLAPSPTDLVERLNIFVVVGSRERFVAKRATIVLAVPRPDAEGQRQLWRQALLAAGIQPDPVEALDGEIAAATQQFEFGPSAIVQAVAAARDRALLRASDDSPSLQPGDLWQACREQVGGRLDEVAQRIVSAFGWDDIVVPADVEQQLHEIADQVANRTAVYERWGFGRRLSRGRGISALFAGPSGTGKTMAAEILANHLRLDLYRIDLAGVVSKYIGETEKNLRRVFDAAEQAGAILFFDEADALFGKRSEVKDSHDRYANIEINYLLQRMEDYRGLAILATNMKSLMDQAFLRRLRFLVDFPFPDAEQRERIWRKVFPPQAALGDLDYALLGGLEIAGGNIRNVAVNAAFLAAAEGTPIRMEHVVRAARREYAKIDKLAGPSEFGPYFMEVSR